MCVSPITEPLEQETIRSVSARASTERDFKEFAKVDLNMIGIRHNEGLDYVLNQIKSGNKNNFSIRNINDFNSLVNKYSIEYAELKGLSMEKSHFITIHDNNLFSARLSKNNEFSDRLNSFLVQLESLSDSDKGDWELSSYITFLNNLENQALNSSLSGDERFIFLSGVSVAKYSFEYWNKNIGKWAELFENKNEKIVLTRIVRQKVRLSPPRFWDNFNWGEIGISDAEGAISSAAGLALSGVGEAMVAGGPAGWVGIGLVIAASSIGASATSFSAGAMMGKLLPAEFKDAEAEGETHDLR